MDGNAVALALVPADAVQIVAVVEREKSPAVTRLNSRTSDFDVFRDFDGTSRGAGPVGQTGLMTAVAADVVAAVVRYAERVHAGLGGGHHVASPLGAWLLLALAGPASSGRLRAELTEVLGADVESAAAAATALLGNPHPLVASAAAVWQRPGVSSQALAGWLAGLPPAVQTGELPSQSMVDGWARERTLGLIDRFPLELTPQVLLVLASALATKVSWATPFDRVPADRLGPASAWAGRLSWVLRSPGDDGHDQFIAVTDGAGEVIVHAAEARDGLLVTSVAALPEVPPGDVLAAAHQVATRLAVGGEVARRSLFDLPLGEGPLWQLTERPASRPGPQQVCLAVLPAWSATSEHDLAGPGLGFDAAAAALAGLLGLVDYQYEAKQSAVARYSRIGFEAAAVTAFAVLESLALHEGVQRVAELRFGHPFAVVAVSRDPHVDRETGAVTHAPWHGMPVFSAWVTDPDDARDAD